MNITINIEISDEKIKQVCNHIINNSFEISNRFYDKPSIGYETIKKQVIELIANLDFKEEINTAIKQLMERGIVKEVTEMSLKSEIKKTVAQMKKNGKLFELVPNNKEQ